MNDEVSWVPYYESAPSDGRLFHDKRLIKTPQTFQCQVRNFGDGIFVAHGDAAHLLRGCSFFELEGVVYKTGRSGVDSIGLYCFFHIHI